MFVSITISFIFYCGGKGTGSVSVKGGEVRTVHVRLTDKSETVTPLHIKSEAVTGKDIPKRVGNAIIK